MKEEFKKEEINEFYQLLTPKVDYHKYYRQTLIPSHLKAISYNLSHGNKNLCFFEISSVYNPLCSEELLILSGMGKLFNQSFHKLTQELDYYWIKGVLENILGWWQLEPEISFSPTSFDYLNASQSSEIFIEKESIGFLGQVNSQISKKYQINELVFIAEISLTKIFNYLDKYPQKISYKPISNFPVSEKDLSFVFPENINYNLVLKEIRELAGDNLQELVMFDIYQNTEMAKAEKKSVSFHLVFQSSTKTLENKEMEIMIKSIGEKIEKLFSAKVRE